ncbi:MAG: PIN domain-containing protein [Treponema sp.]|jgi:predicted nucleic acid-binding protein|nr:PIN domain-containing protein [Treponema sp.]
MIVLIDTNIIIDAFCKRETFAEKAKEILQKCSEKKFSGFIAAHERKAMLLDLCGFMEIAGIDRTKIINIITDEQFDDLEDSLQLECAKSVGAEYIISRNIGDFANSPIPVILPEDFLELTM